MLIAISGSQGSGKTTVLQELKKLGYPVIERKTARSILADWGVTLDTVNVDFDLKQAFQEELVRRKFNDELEASLCSEVIFTERTYSDLFTYALISFGQYNKYDTWLDDYFEKCREHCKNYKHVFYIRSLFSDNIQEDGVRSTNKHYSKMIEREMLGNTVQMIDDLHLSQLTTYDLDDRVKAIQYIVEKIKHK